MRPGGPNSVTSTSRVSDLRRTPRLPLRKALSRPGIDRMASAAAGRPRPTSRGGRSQPLAIRRARQRFGELASSRCIEIRCRTGRTRSPHAARNNRNRPTQRRRGGHGAQGQATRDRSSLRVLRPASRARRATEPSSATKVVAHPGSASSVGQPQSCRVTVDPRRTRSTGVHCRRSVRRSSATTPVLSGPQTCGHPDLLHEPPGIAYGRCGGRCRTSSA